MKHSIIFKITKYTLSNNYIIKLSPPKPIKTKTKKQYVELPDFKLF